MSLRIAINLVAFGLLFAALAAWAVANEMTFGLTTPEEKRVTLEFSASPGLQPGFEVAYLGQAVGTVRDLRLRGDRVAVEAGIEPEARVPAEVTATVRRRSAVGEPYVDLSPREGADLDGSLLAGGARIGREHTEVPISYEEVFTAASDLLETLPIASLNTIVSEVDVALEGSEATLRKLQDDSLVAMSGLAERSELLDEIAADSTALAGTVADLSPTLRQGLDETALLTSELADSPEQLVGMLEEAPGLLDRVTGLAVSSRSQLGCLLDALDASLGELDTPENTRRLQSAVGRSDQLISVLDDVTHERPSGVWLRTDPIFATGNDPIRQYDAPLGHPEEAEVDDCEPRDDFEAPVDLGEADTAGEAEPLGGADGEVPVPGRTEREEAPQDDERAAPESSDREVADEGLPSPLWLLVGGLALGAAVGGVRFLRLRGGGT